MTACVAKPSGQTTYRLVSPWKLIRGLLTMAAAVFLVFTGLSGANAGSTSVELERVVVSQGDTIWGLAEQFSGDTDIEAWIVQFAKLNQLVSSALVPGQSLLLPAD